MISDFREGGRFSKIGESLCKEAFSIGGKSEIGGEGVKNDPKKSDIIYGRPQISKPAKAFHKLDDRNWAKALVIIDRLTYFFFYLKCRV